MEVDEVPNSEYSEMKIDEGEQSLLEDAKNK